LTPWPTYATNWRGVNNFGRGPYTDHSCEVWSKSNMGIQKRRCLSKNVVGQRPVTMCSGELKMHTNTKYVLSIQCFTSHYVVLCKVDTFRCIALVQSMKWYNRISCINRFWRHLTMYVYDSGKNCDSITASNIGSNIIKLPYAFMSALYW